MWQGSRFLSDNLVNGLYLETSLIRKRTRGAEPALEQLISPAVHGGERAGLVLADKACGYIHDDPRILLNPALVPPQPILHIIVMRPSVLTFHCDPSWPDCKHSNPRHSSGTTCPPLP
ncbi:uncharacterized protein CANTADRAFT_335117 [Suhomyces tanzawaensis NRRL Y-17324]|uniref:Uncharacterized protein n=1 Tax=Suhomyces tanzawaensis NRRL Y-17324 TaxID=984487 RepID=A0A1E4SBG0_9ASCO|nr:uncharacterized protein CANTADRAFT_335117 [Suhomyces tanzawaensis NRRL Y-17324]ODV76854.1 hypothetical protein CANTADRAFT_335117 [Suhomyces tanzawaensis NRRL Y-17324]